MKIYTKSGDRMTTGLLDGTRVSKHDERIHLLGNIDELNSMLGVVKSLTGDLAQKEELSGIQRTLMRMMSGIAEASGGKISETEISGTDSSGTEASQRRSEKVSAQSGADGENARTFSGKYQMEKDSIAHLESEIDRMEGSFERIKDFVLPGGSFYSAQIDVARTVARRCERWFAQAAEHYPLDPEAARYLNRLSDYLYVLARYVDASNQGSAQDLIQKQPGTEAITQEAFPEIREKKLLTAETARKAVDSLHRKLNNSYGTFYTFCVCDAEGRQLATNAIAHHSVAFAEAQRAAADALRRASGAAEAPGQPVASGAAAASVPGWAAASGAAAVPGQSVISGAAAVPEDGGAAVYVHGQLAGSVGVYGSYKKDVNEKALMLLEKLSDYSNCIDKNQEI